MTTNYGNSAQGILRAAMSHMKDRASTYDKPEGERSMGSTVLAFAAITGVLMTEEQGWLFMALLKAVRSQQGEYRADSYEDGAAYFALAGESAAKNRIPDDFEQKNQINFVPVCKTCHTIHLPQDRCPAISANAGPMLRCPDCIAESCPCIG